MDDVKWRRWTSWAEKKFGPDRAKVAAALGAVSEAYKRGEDGASAAKHAEAAAAALDASESGGWGAASASLPPGVRGDAGRRRWRAPFSAPAPQGWQGAGGSIRHPAGDEARGAGAGPLRIAAYVLLALGVLLLLGGAPEGLLLALVAVVILLFARKRRV